MLAGGNQTPENMFGDVATGQTPKYVWSTPILFPSNACLSDGPDSKNILFTPLPPPPPIHLKESDRHALF